MAPNKNIINKIIGKLTEYGIQVHKYYRVESKNHYLIWADYMAIAYKIPEKSLSVAFHAATKPDDSATIILVLNQIEEIDTIEVAEPFIHDEDSKVVCGRQAYVIYERKKAKETIQDFISKRAMEQILYEKDSTTFHC